LPLALACAGCGDVGGTTWACTLGTGPSRVCIETSTNVVAPGFSDGCTKNGGVASGTCPRSGADGGCRTAAASGGIMATTTEWFYAGMAAQEMASCVMGQGSTWVSP
jgi:hypothetical protein